MLRFAQHARCSDAWITQQVKRGSAEESDQVIQESHDCDMAETMGHMGHTVLMRDFQLSTFDLIFTLATIWFSA